MERVSRDSNVVFHLSDEAKAHLLDPINSGLSAYNLELYGDSNRTPLVISVASAETNTAIAGLNGVTAWGWLYIQWLWVSESYRGHRIASKLLSAAEREAKERGCHGSYIDTFNVKALELYTRLGYSIFGELTDFPAGETKYFLQKKL